MPYISNYFRYGCWKIERFFSGGLTTCRLPLLQWVRPIPMHICADLAGLHMFKKIKGKKDIDLGLNVLRGAMRRGNLKEGMSVSVIKLCCIHV